MSASRLRGGQGSAFHKLDASGNRHELDLDSSGFARRNGQRPPLGLQAVEFGERTAHNRKLPRSRGQKGKPETPPGICTRIQDFVTSTQLNDKTSDEVGLLFGLALAEYHLPIRPGLSAALTSACSLNRTASRLNSAV
jgi:hypothetical protein